MKRHYYSVCFALLFVAMAAVITLSPSAAALAQGLEISGRVIDKNVKLKLRGVALKVKGTSIGAISDRNGEFKLRVPNASQAVIVASYIGFKTQEIKVESNTSDLVIALEEDVLKTSEIVVTGIATGVKRASLPNAVGTISAKELIPAPAQTVDQALGGKFAGVTIRQNTGAPGGGMSVNLRGVTTLVGTGQPLYIIDGVVMSNDALQGGLDVITNATGFGSPRPQGQPSNRIADLNPNDIEDIQVLKGGSAAAIYGSKATAGVIIITTKKGQSGKTRIDVSQQIGFNSLLRKIGSARFSPGSDSANNGVQAAFPNGLTYDGRTFRGSQLDSMVTANGFIDYEDVFYGQQGLINETSVSASGGADRTQFFISGTSRNEQGIMPNTGFNRYNLRFNLGHEFSDNLKLDLNLGYTNSNSQRGFTGNSNVTNTSVPYAAAALPSFIDIRRRPDGTYPIYGQSSSNPAQLIDILRNNEFVNRFVGATKLDWTIFRTDDQSLRFVGQGGVDYFNQFNNLTSPINTQHERVRALPGRVVDTRSNSLFSNAFLNLIHNYTTESRISFTTTVGAQFENREVNSLSLLAEGLVAIQDYVTNAARLEQSQTITRQYDRGFLIQEEVDIDGKAFVTASIRGDQSSNFGNTSEIYLFPKAAGSVRLSQFDFWESAGLRSTLDEFKIRAAWGQSGNQPFPLAKYGGLVQNNITGTGVGLITPTRRGNPNIRPERLTEIEAGIDASILNGLIGFEGTVFFRDIEDLVVEAELPRSTGFSTQFANAGRMTANGIEGSLIFNPIKNESVDWKFRVNYLQVRQQIVSLGGVTPYNTGGFGQALGTFRIEKGLAPTTVLGVQSRIANNVTDRATIAGDAQPNFNLAFSNDLRIGDFTFYFLIDHQQGGLTINLSRFLTDIGRTTPDGLLAIRARQIANTRETQWIEDATHTRLREASIMFNINREALTSAFGETFSYLRIGLTGRNLFLLTNYTGYDPEVSNFGNVAVGGAVEVTPFPSSRSVFFTLQFGL
jgi:TonB-linked SusC/RagA family outer membrane protein